MSIAAAVVLFVSAGFNILAWPRFYPRIATDARARDADGRPTTFLRVHVTLIVLALVIAVASVVVGVGLLVVG
ncbi:MAG: hypothetical protein HY996_08255 [Micrococcales bacterium]|nr:hypothetical protein [Micrococcales bacterium]